MCCKIRHHSTPHNIDEPVKAFVAITVATNIVTNVATIIITMFAVAIFVVPMLQPFH